MTRAGTVLLLSLTGCFLLVRPDHYRLGNAAENQRRYAECVAELEQVEPSEPHYQEAQFGAGTCRWELGDRERGLAQMIRARRLAPAQLNPYSAKALADAIGAAGERWRTTVPEPPARPGSRRDREKRGIPAGCCYVT